MNAKIEKFLDAVSREIGSSIINTTDIQEYRVHTLPASDIDTAAVLLPSNAVHVKEVVRLANEYVVPLFPISQGRNIGLGSRSPVRDGQVVIDLGRRMNRIIELNETLGYCVIEPGVTFLDLYDKLDQSNSGWMMSPTAGPPDGSVLGNSLDKGGGSGPAGDHFGNICGMEIVLGNGDVIRTGDGGLDAANQPNWHVTKYSFGPALDGLFTQSNYGIVTRVGIWLTKRPAHIRPFFFEFPDDDDLGEIIELIRPLKAANTVPTLIRATNDLYLLSSQIGHPRSKSSKITALTDSERREIQRQYRVGSWTVSGALYGAAEAELDAQLDRLNAYFCQSTKATPISFDQAARMPQFAAAINSNIGKPAAGELGMLGWRPGNGAIWLTPGAPMLGDLLCKLQQECRQIAAANDLDYMASFVCGPRFARGVHAIIFDRTNPDEAERADRTYRGMCDVFRTRGIFVGRSPTLYQEYHSRQRTVEVSRTCSLIKRSIDPNGIIAPGRYGIE